MFASTSSPGRHRADPRYDRPPMGRPLARVVLRAAGQAALIAWAALLVWASFGTGASNGSSGFYMIIGTVASVLLVAVVLASTAARSGLRIIILALVTVVFAAVAGWTLYSAMPEAGPTAYITHRAGVAALSYVFGVIGGGLLALSEFVVEGYSGGRVAVPKGPRRKIVALTTAIVFMAAAAMAPAMQQWAELANQDVRVGDVRGAGAEPAFDELTELAGVERFVETPYGMLRVDHPAEPTPQAVTLLDPATGAAAWYHRRWNWRSAQPPVLSRAQDLVGLSGPRADNPEDYQTRILRTQTGEAVATVRFDGAPGLLMALSGDRLLYAGGRGEVFTVYDFSGAKLWRTTMPVGCEGAAAQMTGARLVMLADCDPAPDRTVARDYVLAFDLDGGALVWEREVDRRAEIVPESFLVTGDAVVIDSRIELRVSDGPYSARRFEHKLLAFDAADGELLWRKRDQVFGSTHSSACGGTLHLSNSTARGEAPVGAGNSSAKPGVGEGGRRTVQLVECYAATHRQGAWLGVMAYDLDTGEQLYHRAIKLGYTPLEPEVARGWATVLPDNRALLASDFSLDPTVPDCRLYEVEDGEAERLDVAEGSLPATWCHDAQLTAVAGGVAISYVNDDGTRRIALVS